jgi:large subunit ribosomal protein L4
LHHPRQCPPLDPSNPALPSLPLAGIAHSAFSAPITTTSINARLLSSQAAALPLNLNLDPVTMSVITAPPPPPPPSLLAEELDTSPLLPSLMKSLSLLDKFNLSPSDLSLCPPPEITSSTLPLLQFHPSLPTPESETVQAPSFLTSAPPLRADLLHRIFVHQRAVKRGRRTAITKTLGTKSGSGKKPHPQKGGGRARAGQARRPQARGGVKAHGPKGIVQDYGDRKMNRGVKRTGVVNALAGRVRDNRLVVVDSFWGEEEGSGKTKYVAEGVDHVFKDVENGYDTADVMPRNGRTLFLMGTVEGEEAAKKSLVLRGAKNVPFVHVLCAKRGVNVADILRNDRIIIDKKGLKDLEERFWGF